MEYARNLQTTDADQAAAAPEDFFVSHMVEFWIVFVVCVLVPWIVLVSKWLRSDAFFMDLGSSAKTIQLDSFRLIQDERDRQEQLEKAGGYLTPAMFKEKSFIDLDPLKDKASTGQLAYWYYLDMINNEIGPLSSQDIRGRWVERNFQMTFDTLIREAWWPEEVHYPVREIFPELNEAEVFIAPPTLPPAIVEIIEHGIRTGSSNLPSETRPSVAVLRTSTRVQNSMVRQKSTYGTQIIDEVLGEAVDV